MVTGSYCDMQVQTEGDDVVLPQSEDPFDDDPGYGAAIYVASSKVRHRLTWGILKGTMQGLWDFLIKRERYMVCVPRETFD